MKKLKPKFKSKSKSKSKKSDLFGDLNQSLVASSLESSVVNLEGFHNVFDSDQFRVFEHEIRVKGMTQVTDKSSKTVLYCLYDGSFTLPKEKYKMITSHRVRWSGFE